MILNLVKITDKSGKNIGPKGKITYQAISDDDLDNLLVMESDYSNIGQDFKVELIDKVYVIEPIFKTDEVDYFIGCHEYSEAVDVLYSLKYLFRKFGATYYVCRYMGMWVVCDSEDSDFIKLSQWLQKRYGIYTLTKEENNKRDKEMTDAMNASMEYYEEIEEEIRKENNAN